jgi:hypothetical protein
LCLSLGNTQERSFLVISMLKFVILHKRDFFTWETESSTARYITG